MYNKYLDVFIQVADTGSFSRAAEKLYISSTAVMKQMNLMKQKLGLSLLVRTNHAITLTELYDKEPTQDAIKFLEIIKSVI